MGVGSYKLTKTPWSSKRMQIGLCHWSLPSRENWWVMSERCTQTSQAVGSVSIDSMNARCWEDVRVISANIQWSDIHVESLTALGCNVNDAKVTIAVTSRSVCDDAEILFSAALANNRSKTVNSEASVRFERASELSDRRNSLFFRIRYPGRSYDPSGINHWTYIAECCYSSENRGLFWSASMDVVWAYLLGWIERSELIDPLPRRFGVRDSNPQQ